MPSEATTTSPRHFDTLAVDEAHNVTLPDRSYYVIVSLRTPNIQTITPHFECKFFINAPIQRRLPEEPLDSIGTIVLDTSFFDPTKQV